MDLQKSLLRSSLTASAEIAMKVADRERQQLDEYTSRIRFGSVTLNAASLVTAATVLPALSLFSETNALVACAFFFVGTVAGGISLTGHQTMLIRTAGRASEWAMHANRAASLADAELGTPTHERLGDAIADCERAVAGGVFEAGVPAIRAQALSLWLWVGGMASIAVTALTNSQAS